MVLLQPPQFFALWAVGQHTLHVGAFGALDELVGLGHQFIVAPEGGGLRRRVVDEATLQSVYHRQTVRIVLLLQDGTFHLDIAEPIVGETWMPCLYAFTFEGVFVIVLSTGLRLVTDPLWREPLRDEQRHFLASLPRQGDFWITGKVLSHVIDKCRGADGAFGFLRSCHQRVLIYRMDALDRVSFHDFYWWCRLWA